MGRRDEEVAWCDMVTGYEFFVAWAWGTVTLVTGDYSFLLCVLHHLVLDYTENPGIGYVLYRPIHSYLYPCRLSGGDEITYLERIVVVTEKKPLKQANKRVYIWKATRFSFVIPLYWDTLNATFHCIGWDKEYSSLSVRVAAIPLRLLWHIV